MDRLEDLPIDKSKKATSEEMNIMNKYFKSVGGTRSKFWQEFKFVIIATILFFIIGSTYFDSFLDYLPNTESLLVKTGLKLLIFATVLFAAIIIFQ